MFKKIEASDLFPSKNSWHFSGGYISDYLMTIVGDSVRKIRKDLPAGVRRPNLRYRKTYKVFSPATDMSKAMIVYVEACKHKTSFTRMLISCHGVEYRVLKVKGCEPLLIEERRIDVLTGIMGQHWVRIFTDDNSQRWIAKCGKQVIAFGMGMNPAVRSMIDMTV